MVRVSQNCILFFAFWGKLVSLKKKQDRLYQSERIDFGREGVGVDFCVCLTRLFQTRRIDIGNDYLTRPKEVHRNCLVYILAETPRDKTRTRVWRVHSSHLPYSRPVLISSRNSRRHVGKSVRSQRKWECLECLAPLSMILAWECECLHSRVLRLVHISPKSWRVFETRM